jgi:hypothetical protein
MGVKAFKFFEAGFRQHVYIDAVNKYRKRLNSTHEKSSLTANGIWQVSMCISHSKGEPHVLPASVFFGKWLRANDLATNRPSFKRFPFLAGGVAPSNACN